jgi:hypothetical protein
MTNLVKNKRLVDLSISRLVRNDMKFKLFTLTFILLAGTAWAQQSVLDTHPKHLFETGKSLFAEKNYPAASRYLENALESGEFAGTETERQAHSYVALSAFYQKRQMPNICYLLMQPIIRMHQISNRCNFTSLF